MKSQTKIQNEEQRKLHERIKTFHEMQASDNPLSNDEIRRLAERNPKTWSLFIGLGKQ